MMQPVTAPRSLKEKQRQEREALGEQNSKLEELLREQQDYLTEIRALVTDAPLS